MKKAAIGFAAGVALMLALYIALMFTGTPFRSMLMKYAAWDGKGIVATGKFLIIYEGAASGGGDYLDLTFAGRNGIVRSFWGAYVTEVAFGHGGIE
jgi:hypothetical protein